ncbi:hypothetical protein C9374_001480 [Naegleria lovaniensis]|uniref:Glutamate decarboxylase n=1 Tax=Naegleria lovaniensis TaxID=51637 RepID=A0AA88GWL2_NAELO|nr:uncharacterized protein C9374_001480 [Naegleria lovaniensis]KAG2387148.1 hypothetical protein C9374_001480 [Naegleria lovaniensis]
MVELKKVAKQKSSSLGGGPSEKSKQKQHIPSKTKTRVPLFQKIVEEQIQPAYPSPILDEKRDHNFEELVKHSLDEILKLKHTDNPHSSYIGNAERILNTEEDIVKYRAKAELPLHPSSPKQVISKVSEYFHGVMDLASPIMLENVNPPSNIPALISSFFGSLYNVAIVQDEYAWNVALTEIESLGMLTKLVGWDPQTANGVFTFGGTGNEMYALKVALTRCLGTQYRFKGIRDSDKVKVFVSEIGHYCKFNTTDWMGIGMDNVIGVQINDDNSMNKDDLYKKLCDSARNGEKIACIIATCGSTDPFGVDDVQSIVQIRDKIVQEYQLDYKPFVYCDSVIGWPWLFFRYYDFEKNPLQIDTQYVLPAIKSVFERIQFLKLADGIGIDFHKTGFSHYVCSCVLFQNGKEFEDNLSRPKDVMHYLYNFSVYKPGCYTLECSRPAMSLSAYSTLLLFGIEGYQSMIAHLVKVQHALRTALSEFENICIVNDLDNGFVTLFRVYPEGINAQEQYAKEFEESDPNVVNRSNEYQKHIANVLHLKRIEQDGPALSYTRCFRKNKHGHLLSAIKAFPMSPFCTEEIIRDYVVKHIVNVFKEVGKEFEDHVQKVEGEGHPLWKYPRHRHFDKHTMHSQ